METVSDYLDTIEYTLKECDPHTGKIPSPAGTRAFTVYKYSILYLVSKQKLKLTDPVDEFYKYLDKFTIQDHYKVANAFLAQTGRPRLNYTQTIYTGG
jgi:hypothetical protein